MNWHWRPDKVKKSLSLLLLFPPEMSPLSSPWVQISLVLQAHPKEPSLVSQAPQISASPTGGYLVP